MYGAPSILIKRCNVQRNSFRTKIVPTAFGLVLFEQKQIWTETNSNKNKFEQKIAKQNFYEHGFQTDIVWTITLEQKHIRTKNNQTKILEQKHIRTKIIEQKLRPSREER